MILNGLKCINGSKGCLKSSPPPYLVSDASEDEEECPDTRGAQEAVEDKKRVALGVESWDPE